MRKLICFLMATIMFVACGKDDFSFNVKEEIKNPYAVTPEEAVQLLQTVIGDETTRSVSISDVQTLTKGNFTQTTRSGADDEVIYIVDIEGGGSAIMGADKRMEPIYAVFDSAKISAEELLGATTRSSSENGSTTDFMFGLLNNAILNDIQEVETAGIEMPLIPRDQTWSETTIISYQEPLLNTAWHQDAPFNNNYDFIPGTTTRYFAGCGPIALAQIIYYNRFPSSINGVTFDWNLIEEYEIGNNNPSNSATIEVANFIYQIKVGTNAQPSGNQGGMGINVNNARDFLNSIGYTNPTIFDYSSVHVVNTVVNNNLPIYARGTKANGEGHAWVIDGCNIYRVDNWVRHYTDAISYTEYIESTQNYNLIHCNIGWEDKDCNAFYASGVFDPHGDLFNVGMKVITYSLSN